MPQLKDGILTEKVTEDKKTEEVLLKEFEILPINAGTGIAVVTESAQNGTDVNEIIYRERVKIKDLPPAAWNISVLKQMSVADFVIIKEEIEKFDATFTFTPPKIRV